MLAGISLVFSVLPFSFQPRVQVRNPLPVGQSFCNCSSKWNDWYGFLCSAWHTFKSMFNKGSSWISWKITETQYIPWAKYTLFHLYPASSFMVEENTDCKRHIQIIWLFSGELCVITAEENSTFAENNGVKLTLSEELQKIWQRVAKPLKCNFPLLLSVQNVNCTFFVLCLWHTFCLGI